MRDKKGWENSDARALYLTPQREMYSTVQMEICNELYNWSKRSKKEVGVLHDFFFPIAFAIFEDTLKCLPQSHITLHYNQIITYTVGKYFWGKMYA